MNVVYRLLFLAVGAVWSDMAGECDMVRFYQELGCTPTSQINNHTGCPEVFKCPDLHPNPNKCYYRGVAYNAGDVIPQSLVNNPCIRDCRCNIGTEVSFQCAAVDCVESLDHKEVTRRKRKVGKLTICEVDGKKYNEGQKFYSNSTGKTCLCTADWNGSTDDVTYCTDINCGIQINYQNHIRNRCAPVFLGSAAGTCPIRFECPINTTNLIRSVKITQDNNDGVKARSYCYWGRDYWYYLGQPVSVRDKDMYCICLWPPYVTCSYEA